MQLRGLSSVRALAPQLLRGLAGALTPLCLAIPELKGGAYVVKQGLVGRQPFPGQRSTSTIGCGRANSEGQNTMIDNPMAGPRAMTWIVGVAVALAISSTADGRTFHDASGRVTGHSRTDSRGVTTFYDSSNRITGRARTGVNGTTTFYDASGRVTGKSR